MTANGWLQIFIFLVVIFLVTKPLGVYMTRVFDRKKTLFDPLLRPLERLLYKLTGVNETHEMRWTEYAFAMLCFSVIPMIVLYAIERLQQWLAAPETHSPGPPRAQPAAGRSARDRSASSRPLTSSYLLARTARQAPVTAR